MANSVILSSLPAPRRRLIRLMQEVRFGRIENLPVSGGEPVLDPMPRRIFKFPLDKKTAPPPERPKGDFILKAQVVELLRLMSRFRNGIFLRIEIQNGIPVYADFEEKSAA